MRLLAKCLFFTFLLISIERLCHKATDGFAMANVYAPPGDNNAWKRSDSLNGLPLSQTYRYLACGSQSYVFLSEDGSHVLKLFKFQHMRVPPWLQSLPLLKDKKEAKRDVLKRTFDSISLAYDTLREETGLLYIHLAKTTHLQTHVTLIDKIGKSHHLNLDEVEFILQKRGTLVYSAINEWMERGEFETARESIHALLKLALNRCQKGIFDKDPDFSTNFGYIGTTPFQIDFGRLRVDPKEKEPTTYRPEMIRITRDFENWIEKNHPDLLSSFRQDLKAVIE